MPLHYNWKDGLSSFSVPTECDPEDVECPYGMSLIWEASTEIQSGDVLIVRIDDKTLRRDLSDEDDSG
ncbi:hypothetical protein RUM44_002545 [Polyplax serrata]|uniref:Uncharacterized protein n=1 Tax=Polyplax serrata TaxID=468196 RepID=A0ABR1AGK3_POLSC